MPKAICCSGSQQLPRVVTHMETSHECPLPDEVRRALESVTLDDK
jgi:hypothetical protein